MALDELLDVTREIDMQDGTNILSGLWNNIIKDSSIDRPVDARQLFT